MNYGKEVIIDLHDCDIRLFNRQAIENFFVQVCDLINMERRELFFWDDFGLPESEQQTSPKTKGTSAVQFILTSNITIHTLDLLKSVYLNVFSCKDFDDNKVVNFAKNYFCGKVANRLTIGRI